MHFNFLATSFPDSYSLSEDGRAIATLLAPPLAVAAAEYSFLSLAGSPLKIFCSSYRHLCLRFELISFVLDI